MLILTRKLNEIIKIGDDIEVMVVKIIDDKVRLGITAPVTTSVHRKEVYDVIVKQKANNQQELPDAHQVSQPDQ